MTIISIERARTPGSQQSIEALSVQLGYVLDRLQQRIAIISASSCTHLNDAPLRQSADVEQRLDGFPNDANFLCTERSARLAGCDALDLRTAMMQSP
jgi:hypothetical protein